VKVIFKKSREQRMTAAQGRGSARFGRINHVILAIVRTALHLKGWTNNEDVLTRRQVVACHQSAAAAAAAWIRRHLSLHQ